MGGVNCIQTFFGFLEFFFIYKVPNKHLAMSKIDRHPLSTLPLRCGEYGAESSCLITFLINNASNWLFTTSVPLSLLIHLTLPNTLTSAKYFSAASNVCFFLLQEIRNLHA